MNNADGWSPANIVMVVTRGVACPLLCSPMCLCRLSNEQSGKWQILIWLHHGDTLSARSGDMGPSYYWSSHRHTEEDGAQGKCTKKWSKIYIFILLLIFLQFCFTNCSLFVCVSVRVFLDEMTNWSYNDICHKKIFWHLHAQILCAFSVQTFPVIGNCSDHNCGIL